MRISVAVITYNWPQALALVLRALAAQSELPFEVIVTDDGSRDDTRALLQQLAHDYPTRLVHLWQPDDGARMSRARNRAIAAARGDYVVLLDGDMVAERHFIADHRAFARAGCFVQGSRVLTDAALTERMLARQRTSPDNCLVYGASVLGARKYYLPTGCVRYRIHGKNAWASNRSAQQRYENFIRSRRLISHYARVAGLDDSGCSIKACKYEYLTKQRPPWRETLRYANLIMERRVWPPWSKWEAALSVLAHGWKSRSG
jgi:glycosyltransferase involved in cell wall biosynthesis